VPSTSSCFDREILAPGIVIYKNNYVITQKDLNLLDQQCEDALSRMYTFMYDDDGNLEYAVNRSFHKMLPEHIDRTSIRITENLDPVLVGQIEQSISNVLLDYIDLYPDLLRSIWWRSMGHFCVYKTGANLGLHSDNDVNYRPKTEPIDQGATRHTLSCTTVLNDDFQGGDLYFEYYDLTVSPKAGDIVFFPSNYLATHCVQEVTEGVRYSYVSFYGHGSADEKHKVIIQDFTGYGSATGKIWMDDMYEEFAKFSTNPNAKRIIERIEDH